MAEILPRKWRILSENFVDCAVGSNHLECARVGIADTYYSQMLARLIGPVRTRDLMFTGRTLSAQEALEWGMMARVVPYDELADTAWEARL